MYYVIVNPDRLTAKITQERVEGAILATEFIDQLNDPHCEFWGLVSHFLYLAYYGAFQDLRRANLSRWMSDIVAAYRKRLTDYATATQGPWASANPELREKVLDVERQLVLIGDDAETAKMQHDVAFPEVQQAVVEVAAKEEESVDLGALPYKDPHAVDLHAAAIEKFGPPDPSDAHIQEGEEPERLLPMWVVIVIFALMCLGGVIVGVFISLAH